jgi:translation initiation factor 1 (eIF-1/SUI1)
MNLAFSSHALKRMKERGVTRREVKGALDSPEKHVRKNGEKAALKRRANGHLLIVIFTGTRRSRKVITVIDTSKVSKYL